MDKLVEKIADAVRECSKIIMSAERSKSIIDSKEGHANFVTLYDKKVQEELFLRLREILPEAVLVGEEEDVHSSIEKGFAFIVDPIDGTTNFIKDYKTSCISVGLTKDGQQYIGVVYNPYLDEMFTAQAGKGAYLNGRPISVSKEPMSNSIVLMGTAPYYEELRERTLELIKGYLEGALDIRRSGSAALDLCAVAAGRADYFVELRLCPWDFAAGSLIVKEAGGIVTTCEEQELTLDRSWGVVAFNGIKELFLTGIEEENEKTLEEIEGVISINRENDRELHVIYNAKVLGRKDLLEKIYSIVEQKREPAKKIGVRYTDPLDK